MGGYAIRRVLLFIPTVVVLTMIVYFVMWIIPGDPALFILTGGGEDDGGTGVREEDLQLLRHELGIDRPIYIRYADWMWHLIRGDFGESIWYKIPVMDELKNRFPVSIQLAVMAIVISVVLAVPLGVLSAVKQDTPIDYMARLFTISGVALPTFWIGILIVFILAFWFNWLPPLGYAKVWEEPLKNLQQLIFPALALGFHDLAAITRLTRSSMLEVLKDDYIRTARSKGLREGSVLYRHALKNAILPVLTVSGLRFAGLLGGVVIIENIFVVPGIGNLLIDAIIHQDFIVIQAVVVLTAVIVVCLNLVVDLLYGVIDPRIRYN